jgi:transposase
MPRAYSDDLRCRILLAYERGEGSLAGLARRFEVGGDYVKKIRRQQLRTGQKERVPQLRHGPVSRITAAIEQQLRAHLRAQPDLTLWELRQRLRQASGVELSKSLLWLCLQRLELRRKKNPSTPASKTRTRADSNARRGGSR